MPYFLFSDLSEFVIALVEHFFGAHSRELFDFGRECGRKLFCDLITGSAVLFYNPVGDAEPL